MQVWIVGEYKEGKPWEFFGVFSTREKAIAACTDEQHFIAPYTLDERAPDETVPMPGMYYPVLGLEPDYPSKKDK